MALIALLLGLTLAFYRHIVFSDRASANLNLLLHAYPYRDYLSDLLAQGHLPLWNPYLFLGAPLLAEPSLGVLYPLNMLGVWWEAPRAISYAMAGSAFLGGVFMYALARASLAVGPLAALVAALVYSLGGFTASRLGQPEVTGAAAWLPLALLGADQAFRRRNPALLALGGLALAMEALAGGLHVLYITMLALFALGARHAVGTLLSGARAVARADGRRRWLALGRWLAEHIWLATVFLGLPALGFGLAAVQLLPTWELWQRSALGDGRPFAEAMAGSLPPQRLLQALLPSFRDNLPGQLIAYVGILPLGLALLAAVRRAREGWTWLFLLLAGAALVLALGRHNPAMPWLFDHLPWLNRFTGPTTWLLLYSFALAALAGLGAEVVVRGAPWRGAVNRAWDFWRNGLRPLLSLAAPALALAIAIVLLRDDLTLPRTGVWQVWIALALIAFDIIYILPMLRLRPWTGMLVALLVVGELFLAGARLPAFATLPPEAARPPLAIAGLLSHGQEPRRVLSQVEAEVSADEGGPAFTAVEAAAVQQLAEALVPNLTLSYGLGSLEGSLHQLLPLEIYRRLQVLLTGEESASEGLLSLPGLRREGVEMPSLDLLAALGVTHIVDDRRGDLIVEGATFDMTGEAVVGPGQTVIFEVMPSLAADALALVSYLDAAAVSLPQDSFVGTLTLVGRDGETADLLLRAGIETAVGPYQALGGAARHRQATVLSADPRQPVTSLYITLIPISAVAPLREVRIANLLAGAAIHVRAISLLDRYRGASQPLLLDKRLTRLEAGPLKVYRLEATRPRAFLVRDFRVVSGEEELIEGLRDHIGDAAFFTQPPPLTPQQREGLATAPRSAAPARVEVASYQPEQVVVATASEMPGFLILSDAYYPGWRARLDGVETPLLEADGMFRAVYLPAGEHRVEFRYQPQSFDRGWKVSLYSLGAAAGLVLAPLVGSSLRLLWWLRRPLTRLLATLRLPGRRG